MLQSSFPSVFVKICSLPVIFDWVKPRACRPRGQLQTTTNLYWLLTNLWKSNTPGTSVFYCFAVISRTADSRPWKKNLCWYLSSIRVLPWDNWVFHKSVSDFHCCRKFQQTISCGFHHTSPSVLYWICPAVRRWCSSCPNSSACYRWWPMLGSSQNRIDRHQHQNQFA